MTSALGLLPFLRRFGIACVVVALVAVGVMSLGDRAGQHEFGQRHVVDIGAGILAPVRPAQPANYLLIGHDDTGHSDTMMVVHVDPAVPTPLVVSFPRDLIVEIPGHGSNQLNAAITFGGVPLLIETFKSYFNIPINHFLQVDFAGFPDIVSAIGHVNVYFPTPVHDPYIGLDIEKAGCVSLDGQQALAYARSRHYYVPDDLTNPAPWVWNYDPKLGDGAYRGGKGWTAFGGGRDIERIPRQQYFLRTLAQTAINRTDDNPLRLFALVPAIMKHLSTDQNLTLGELKSLVHTFRKLRPADIEMTTLPWSTDPANHNRVIADFSAATPLLFRLANFAPIKPFLPPLVNPRTVRIRVVNGSGITGLGARALAQLVAAGFTSVGPAQDADRSTYVHTQVRWGADHDVKGVTVTYATGATQSGQAAQASDTKGSDVLIVVGRDWNHLKHKFTGLATKSATTTTAGGHSDPTTPTTAATTTTTSAAARNYLPVDPKTGGVLVGCPKS